jgi:hypothetical protein
MIALFRNDRKDGYTILGVRIILAFYRWLARSHPQSDPE